MKGIFVYVMFYLHTAAFFVWVDRSDNDDDDELNVNL